MKKHWLLLLVPFALAACEPNYHFSHPVSAAGKSCVDQCKAAARGCEASCDAHDRHCEVSGDTDLILPTLNANGPGCYDRSCHERCDTAYRHCFTQCGGTITTTP